MKRNIKELMLEKRNSLSRQEFLEKSLSIRKNLESIKEYSNAKTVMYYVSFDSEVDTHDLIRNSLGKKTVIVPKVEYGKIEPSLIIAFDNLIAAQPFGILEPIEIMKIANKNIDAVIVPGIAFDMEGYRIGYGMGYYDVFLKKVPKALKIGLAYELQIVENIPREDHDVPVDIIVTEKRVITCHQTKNQN